MDAGTEPCTVGNHRQQRRQIPPLFLRQRRQQFTVVLGGHALCSWKQRLRPFRQVQCVRSAVPWMAPAFDEACRLELVDEADHHVPVDPHRVSQLLLRRPGGLPQVSQHPVVPRMQPDRRQTFREPRGRVGPDLREQERCLPLEDLARLLLHVHTVSDCDCHYG